MLARIAGGVMVVVGLVAATSPRSWAGWIITAGPGLWFAGSWLHAVKTSYYSSPLARPLLKGTPLKWTLWQHRRTHR